MFIEHLQDLEIISKWYYIQFSELWIDPIRSASAKLIGFWQPGDTLHLIKTLTGCWACQHDFLKLQAVLTTAWKTPVTPWVFHFSVSKSSLAGPHYVRWNSTPKYSRQQLLSNYIYVFCQLYFFIHSFVNTQSFYNIFFDKTTFPKLYFSFTIRKQSTPFPMLWIFWETGVLSSTLSGFEFFIVKMGSTRIYFSGQKHPILKRKTPSIDW